MPRAPSTAMVGEPLQRGTYLTSENGGHDQPCHHQSDGLNSATNLRASRHPQACRRSALRLRAPVDSETASPQRSLITEGFAGPAFFDYLRQHLKTMKGQWPAGSRACLYLPNDEQAIANRHDFRRKSESRHRRKRRSRFRAGPGAVQPRPLVTHPPPPQASEQHRDRADEIGPMEIGTGSRELRSGSHPHE